MKKGFTLIELLAVIIILAILMVVAVPNVLSTLNDAKEKTFVTQAQSIWKAAEQKFIVDSLTGSQSKCYDLSNPLDLGTVSDSISYVVEMDVQTGKVVSINVLDTTQNFKASGTTTNGITVSVESSNTALVCGGETYLDETIAVAPKLGNMIPIKWDGSKWIYAKASEKWYDYANKEWANAVVLSESAGKKKVGDEITESEIDLWFVWVPRYEYKLPADSIGTIGTPKAIDINFISSSVTTPTEGYAFHPGFAWDSDWSDGISEWKDGMWIGKFESTAAEPESNSVQKIKIKADISPWREADLQNIYTSGLNLDTDYRITNLDSHMTRYTEWSAISYFTNSIYGLCSSATSCVEIGINQTEYFTGAGNYKANANLSTTGNITGIYDMRGGVYEKVMGGLKESVIEDFGENQVDNKYVDVFTSSNPNIESYSFITSVNGTNSMNGIFKELAANYDDIITWYADALMGISLEWPWFGVGLDGEADMSVYSGIFASGGDAKTGAPNGGMRVALVSK